MKRCTKCNKRICNCDKFEKDHLTWIIEQSSDCCTESSFNCPKKIPTPLFSSPNSALSEAQLNELQLCIEEANDLLRSLGTLSDPINTRQLQLHLLKLQGVHVSVKIICECEEEIKGVLGTTGRDFIQLDTKSGCIFILFERLISLSQLDNYQEHELDDIEIIDYEEIVLNFGEFVSKQPELVNLFFGIALHVQLKKYIGKNVQVKTDKEIVSGTLLSVDENNILIKNLRKENRINISDICFLEIKK